MIQFRHNYGRPRTLINGFRTPVGSRNPATGRFRNHATIVNVFRNPAALVNGFRNPATADSGTRP